MTRIILDRRQLSLEYATDCIIIRADAEPPRTLPLVRIEQLICMHSVQLTTQLIGQLHKRGIDLIVLNQRHENHSFALFADQRLQVERRCRQYAWQLDEVSRLEFSRQICDHKFRVLARIIGDSGSNNRRREQIGLLRQQVPTCSSEAQLRGLEGSVQRLAFDHWRGLIPPTLGFKQRQRRPPPDPVNAALSLAYTLVHHEAVRQARSHALDPQLGFYHRIAYGRQSLACDLMEPIRPRVEAWVTHLFASKTLDKRQFSTAQGSCMLGKSGRQIFYAEYDQQSGLWRRRLAAGARWIARRLDQQITVAP